MANEYTRDAQALIDALLVCTDTNYTCLDCNRYRESIKAEFVSDCVHDLMLEAVWALKAQQKRIAELETNVLNKASGG